MKNSKKSKKVKHDKASIDLPAQKVWEELREHGAELSQKENASMDCEKLKKIEGLFDKAFDLILKKLIRQN